MSNDEASMPLTSKPTNGEAHQPPPEGSIRALAKKSATFSRESTRLVKIRHSYAKNRRYVDLKHQEIFDSLVSLYTAAFSAQWHNFRRTADSHLGQLPANQAQRQLALVYISHWIIDLYNTNKEVMSKLTPVAYTERFMEEYPAYSNEYDNYLIHLNTCMRPTHIKGCYEDVLFIPTFEQTDPWGQNHTYNPFGIINFELNSGLFRSILSTIKEKKTDWKTDFLTTETVGRPVWLFDWVEEDEACAWFPREGNYTTEDVLYAYILGVACTPKLAHRDSDNLQPFPDNVRVDRPVVSNYRRQRPRRYFGAYDVQDMSMTEKDITIRNPDTEGSSQTRQRKRKKVASSVERDTTQPQRPIIRTDFGKDDSILTRFQMFRLETFIYYARVIFDNTFETRFNSMMTVITDSESFMV
uniref:Capsid protein n=1 Tax=Pyrus pyrifolia cryptic virus TaxID=1968822 RepID=A0A224AUG6_9VIRU|nr:capsid protein [Pyrus pyrifolia cryptic virus]